MEESIFMDGVRAFFAMLDRMAYSLITIFYNTINDLAAAQLVKTDVINQITGRMYALLGIFMLFKVSFSLINYIVDPNQIDDKTRGGGALIKRIVITFALIVSTPFAFNMIYEAQSAILADQLIPRFLLGVEVKKTPDKDTDTGVVYRLKMTGCSNDIEVPNMGNYLGLAIFKPFFIPQDKDSIGDNDVGKVDEEVYNDLYCNGGEKLGEASVKNMLSDDDLYNAPKGWSTDNYYTMDYSFGLSTAIGIVIALILLGYCFDIATRAFKLLFLEIIAPIPIMSYVDPDSSKSGMFIKWLKEVAGTWVSLFTRLASLFLAIFVIQEITATDGNLYFVNGYEFHGNIAWIKILIIIGALMFAKQLPKILENILGFQLGGNMTVNPLKKLDSEALGFSQARKAAATGASMAAGAAVGALGGMGANAWAARVNNKEAMKAIGRAGEKWRNLSFEDKSKLRQKYYEAGGRSGIGNVGSIIAGGASASARSAAAASKQKGKFVPLRSAEVGITGSSTARRRRASGYGIFGQMRDRATDVAGISKSYGTTSELKNRKKQYEQQLSELEAKRESLRDQLSKITASNPKNALAYQTVLQTEKVTNSDGTVKKDEYGNDMKRYKYDSYTDYQDDYYKRLNEYTVYTSGSGEKTGEEMRREKEAELDELRTTNPAKYAEDKARYDSVMTGSVTAEGMLSKDEFDRARIYDQQIASNERDIKSAKREISKVEENMKPVLGGKPDLGGKPPLGGK